MLFAHNPDYMRLVQMKRSALNITTPKSNIVDSFLEEKKFRKSYNSIKQELEKGGKSLISSSLNRLLLSMKTTAVLNL